MTSPREALEPLDQSCPILDLHHLRTFTDGDPALESELLGLYLASADGYLREMNDALLDARDWQPAAHALKGASANLGARRVEALAKAAERQPPDPHVLADLRAAVGDVQALFERRRP